jgi:outer membrane receptor protein involved in Fe transport
MRPFTSAWSPLSAATMLAGAAFGLHAQTPPPLADEAPVQQVEIIGTSPLPGQGVDRALLPYTTQLIRRDAIDQAQADHSTDLLARRVPGAQVNDIQGSPFQGDLTFHGFRASGLLGASQGLSVYLDGVRINEPFGDVVNWDLIPEFAVQSLSLVPGANPAYGLNTLGGALAFGTASGLSAPGGRAELMLGSFGRRKLELAYGRSSDDGWHQYLGGAVFQEDGWRDHSPGKIGQAFVKIGRSLDDTAWTTSLLLGRSELVGNGLVPAATLAQDGSRTSDLLAFRRETIYTHPDRTQNQLAQWQVNLQHRLPSGSDLSALVYARQTRRDTLNGDTVDEAQGDLNASLNTTAMRQSAAGAAASASGRRGSHLWQAGMTFDASEVKFRQQEQAGLLTADRGVQAGDEPPELSAALKGTSWSLGLFAGDTWQLQPGTHVTATLRAHLAQVANTLTSVDDDTGETEAHPRETFRYQGLNPALGLTQSIGGGLVAFGNLARNTRVPSAIELGCADPEEPCRLPAGLQSDPYLKPVRSTSAELGLRWKAPGQSLTLSVFRIDNRDDIVFGSVSATSQLGYFRNFPRTRHDGLDLAWEASTGAWSWQAAFSLLDATYQAADTLRMGDRNIAVTPGTRMAGLPRQTVKLALDWQAAAALSLGADVQSLSRRGVLGNEDSRIEDGAEERVDLALPGYAVLNLRASWKPAPGWELFARVGNATDRRYASYGALAETVFDAQGVYTGDERAALFVAPGSPRSVQVGARLAF